MKRLLLIACLSGSSLFAVLPPLAQNIREIEAMLADSRFYEALGSPEMIQDIIHIDGGYLVLTQHYALRVEVHYLPAQRIGPAAFELIFQPPMVLKERPPLQ
jgi:hypothetical protein